MTVGAPAEVSLQLLPTFYWGVLVGREQGEVITATLEAALRKPSLRGSATPRMQQSGMARRCWWTGPWPRPVARTQDLCEGPMATPEDTWCLIHLFINSLNPQTPCGEPCRLPAEGRKAEQALLVLLRSGTRAKSINTRRGRCARGGWCCWVAGGGGGG